MSIANRRSRPTRSPEVIFVSTFAVVLLFALYSFGKGQSTQDRYINQARSLRVLEGDEIECRLVNDAPTKREQCAFVRANCPDEEAGLISYLQLYYCTLADAKPLAFTIIVVWVSLLFSTIGIAASDFLCINLSTIAAILGMSESLTGVTFLAFGNGSPDVFSTFAAMSSNSGSLAVGELMGAAGFITAVVAGSMALVKPFQVARKSFVRDVVFFAVAASFSLVFLVDGSLRLWECVAMVAFYIFYVVFVVAWHWWLQKQRRQRLAETAARLHHHIPEHQELEAPLIEIDEESRPAAERSPLLQQQHSSGTIPTLITPSTPAWRARDEDDEEEQRDRYLAELQSNMRVNRASRRDRRNTITPIRPSLIGAIEFRSVLNALEKRSTTNPSIGLRRYSDDGQQDTTTPYLAVTSADNEDAILSPGDTRGIDHGETNGSALNSNRLTPARGTSNNATYNPRGADRPTNLSVHRRSVSDSAGGEQLMYGRYSPNLLLSPLSMTSTSSEATSPRPFTYPNGMLAPPPMDRDTFNSPNYQERSDDRAPSPMLSPNMDVPILKLPHPGHTKSPLAHEYSSPVSTPSSTRPPSIHLPPPLLPPESAPVNPVSEDEEFPEEMKRYNWWPYEYLPAPQIILATLFPTLYGWKSKGIIGKIVGIATTPSVFLLTITLPVVEPREDDDEQDDVVIPNSANDQRRHSEAPVHFMGQSHAQPKNGTINGSNRPGISRNDTNNSKMASIEETSVPCQDGWNRWLVILQLFTAPLFVVLIVWASLDEDHSIRDIVLLFLGSLVFSLTGLFFLLMFTTSTREPKFRPILCFLGFAVATAWISTIADEVVGVLKAIGVILDISDAILGLTIFAVGNSLGDLVADITVAKLGYPVMALSACFGGPMLNILLGIGLGGIYMTVRNGRHRHHKHPDKPIQYKPYELEISTTLMISGITLLVTLIGLLIVVPLNGWRMDRKIGIGLITLWTLSTIGNVICEVLGVGVESLGTR